MIWYCYRVETVSENAEVQNSPREWTEVELHLCLQDTRISDPAVGKVLMQGDLVDEFVVGEFYAADFTLVTDEVHESA